MGKRGVKPKDPARFWAHVDKTGCCWLWTGCLTERGYGRCTFGKGTQKAHRVAYELTVGLIPEGLLVCHDCPGGDNPRCVNPSHLFLGTKADNTRDMRLKGRGGNKTARLTPMDVHDIRYGWLKDIAPRAAARLIGCDECTVHDVRKRRTWRHVP